MKRIVKYFICLALVFGGILSTERKANAQFVVSDPTNLVQSILNYLLDQFQEGNLSLTEGLSKLDGMREQFAAAREKLDQAMLIIQKYGQYAAMFEDVKAVAYIYNSISNDLILFGDIEYYLSSMSSYQTVATVGSLMRSFNGMTESLIAEVKNEMFDISKITQGDPVAISAEMRKLIEYLYSGYAVIREYFITAYRTAYYESMSIRANALDNNLFGRFMY